MTTPEQANAASDECAGYSLAKSLRSTEEKLDFHALARSRNVRPAFWVQLCTHEHLH
jgi:hypothetical protein